MFRRNSETPPLLNFITGKKKNVVPAEGEMDSRTSFSAHKDELPVMTAI